MQTMSGEWVDAYTAADVEAMMNEDRTRLRDAIIAVDAIEHRHCLENSGDLAERIERIGHELEDAQRKLTEAFDSEIRTAGGF
jgi:hypothetical protein